MAYDILVWFVARLFGFRLWSDTSTQHEGQLISPVDFIGSLGVSALATLPIVALSSVVDLFVGIPWLQPAIGWLQAFLNIVIGLVMILAMLTWSAFLVHLRNHRWAEFSAHHQRQLALLARIVPPFYCAVGMILGLLFAIILMETQRLPWWAGALIFVALFWVGDRYRKQSTWGISVLDRTHE